MSDAPPKSHNLPSLAETLAPDVISALIAAEIEPLKTRADDLVASCKRFLAKYPTIDGNEADSLAAEILAVCGRFTGSTGRVEMTRVALKKPVLEADNAIGSLKKGPFAKLVEIVETAASTIRRESIAYKQRIEAEIRRKAQAEADARAAEARMAEEMASKGSGLVTFDDAANAAQAADVAQRQAEAKPAELTRSHGDGIGTTSLKYKRIVTIVEPSKVDRIYCTPDLAALTRAAGKAGTPFPKLSGCSVSDVPDLNVRK